MYDQTTKPQRTKQNNKLNVKVSTLQYRGTGQHFSVGKEGLHFGVYIDESTLNNGDKMVKNA